MNEVIAKALCDANTLQFGLFSFYGGRKSPVYANLRNLPSYPEAFKTITKELVKVVKELDVDIIAGAETAGIPIASAMAIESNMPMVYVRKRPKTYGNKSSIEGIIEKNKKVVLIDDMVTDGKSKKKFIEGIRKEGAIVKDVLVILDREQGATENLAKDNIKLHRLITLRELLEFMKEKDLVDKDNYGITMNYIKNPEQWNK